MKKITIISLILAAAVFMVSCTAVPAEMPDVEETAEAIEAEMPDAEETAEVIEAAVPDIMAQFTTLPQNGFGLVDSTIADIAGRLAKAEPFYLYIAGDDSVPFDSEAIKQGFADFQKNFECPIDICYIDESLLSDIELGAVEEMLGLEKNSITTAAGSVISSFSGLYAFDEGGLKNRCFDLVPTEENSDIAREVTYFIFSSDLFRNDHGWEILSYEQLRKKIDSGKRFMVYIGRDTCPYCVPFVKSLMSAFENAPANIPMYFFYTQPYNTAINNNEAGAQEAWDAVKKDIGFKYTPSFIVFDGGDQAEFCDLDISSVAEDYFSLTDEEKAAAQDELAVQLADWLKNKGLTN